MKMPTKIPFEFTVLIVDDDDKYRTQTAENLRSEGFQVIEANVSSTACALIRDRKASLVLLDWDLQNHKFCPEEPSTGWQILQTCREIDALLPVIVMSKTLDHDAQTDSLMAGADGFLEKPVAKLSLTVHLHRWIARLRAEKNPFTQLTAGVIEKADTVNRAYARAVVDKVGSALQAAPKLGLSRRTIASYLASPSHP